MLDDRHCPRRQQQRGRLQELRIESFFPADVESERALKVLLAGISSEFPGE